MANSEKRANEQRSDVKNPNNKAHELDRLNRVKQEQAREAEPNPPPNDKRSTASVISVDLVRAALRSEDMAGIPVKELLRDAADYERFLLLVKTHWDAPVAPTKAIDRMWHLHMLHPRAYYEDCMRLFGEILDHDGGFGATTDEALVLERVFEVTSDLWLSAYGTPYLGSLVACTRNCVSRCKRACKTISASQASA